MIDCWASDLGLHCLPISHGTQRCGYEHRGVVKSYGNFHKRGHVFANKFVKIAIIFVQYNLMQRHRWALLIKMYVMDNNEKSCSFSVLVICPTTDHGWSYNSTRFISIIWEQRTRISKYSVFRQTSGYFYNRNVWYAVNVLTVSWLTVYWNWRSTGFPWFILKFQYSSCHFVVIFTFSNYTVYI